MYSQTTILLLATLAACLFIFFFFYFFMSPLSEFDSFFIYYIVPVGAVVFFIWFLRDLKERERRFAEEEVFLNTVGLKRIKRSIIFDNTFIKIPSRGVFNFGAYENTITSKDKPNLLIFKWNVPSGRQTDPIYPTRVFSFKSKKQGKTFPFPLFILRPEGPTLDKVMSDIDYEEHPEFSDKFFLTAQGGEENHEKVRSLFDNPALHDYLINNPMNIESNGKQVFYFWYKQNIPVEELPENIDKLEKLHDSFFDI